MIDMRYLAVSAVLALSVFAVPSCIATPQDDGSVLPFPAAPSASKAGPTLQQSMHRRRVEPDRLPAGAPNVLIVLIDDAGFGVPDTFVWFCAYADADETGHRSNQL